MQDYGTNLSPGTLKTLARVAALNHAATREQQIADGLLRLWYSEKFNEFTLVLYTARGTVGVVLETYDAWGDGRDRAVADFNLLAG